MTREPDDDLVPVSVRLGEVVPPEDPEDWTRPLTWVAALGMLAGPLVAFAWFAVARPTSDAPMPATFLVAAALAAGAALTGATQQGLARAWTATLGAGLFGALVVVVLGVAMADERTVGAFPPTVAQAAMAAVAGLAGTAAASLAAAFVARSARHAVRFIVPVTVGVAISTVVLGVLVARQPSASGLDEKAGGAVGGADREERWIDGRASVEGDRAARMEAAARRDP